MIKVYLANLGKYNEGELVGEWLELPCEEEDIQETMIKIGVAHMDGDKYVPYVEEKDEQGRSFIYEEFAIHDYEIEEELNIKIGEYDNLENLNNLAQSLSELQSYQMETVVALVDVGYLSQSELEEEDLATIADDTITIRLDTQTILSDEANLGYAYVAEIYGDISQLDKQTLENHFDYESFGRELKNDFSISSNGLAVSRK